MGVYIKRYGDYVMIGSQVPQEGYEWYDGEIPQLTDYDLQYHKWQDGKIVVGYKYSLEQLKEMKLKQVSQLFEDTIAYT